MFVVTRLLDSGLHNAETRFLAVLTTYLSLFPLVRTIPYSYLLNPTEEIIAILFLEYILTLDSETQYFWRTKRLGWGTVLFLANRYLSLFGYAPLLATLVVKTESSSVSKYSTLLPLHQLTMCLQRRSCE